jgi:hypothetical protein
MVGKSFNIFARVPRLLTNTFYCCIQTFRAITGTFDRLMGARFVTIELAASSRENRKGSLGHVRNGWSGVGVSPLKLISISRG